MSGILAATLGSGPVIASITASPTGLNITTGNGTNISVATLTAVVSGGSPPYTYAWTDNNENVTLSAPSASSTSVLSSGTDLQNTVSVTLTVTDAASFTGTASKAYNITHGTP